MGFLFSLSKYISIPIFCDWLQVKDLGRIDSANCNKVDRVPFLDLIQLEVVQFPELDDEVIALSSYVNWLSLRNLRVFQLNFKRKLWSKFDTKMAAACLENLKSLSAEDGTVPFRDKFVAIIGASSSLTFLNLANCKFVNDKVIRAIANNCCQLTTFCCPNEDSVNHDFKDSSLILLTKKCAQLEVLQLGNCSEITDLSGRAILDNCRHLLDLTICNLPKLTDSTFNNLSKLSRLTNLYVRDCPELSYKAINNIFMNGDSLVSLSILMSPLSKKQVAATNPHINPIHLLSLRLVDVRVCEEHLERLTKICVNLRELMLIGVTVAHVSYNSPPVHLCIARNCHNLEELTLRKMVNLTESELMEILQACGPKKLSLLSIEATSYRFGMLTLGAIQTHCFQLKTLVLTNISDLNLLSGVVRHCILLQSLDLCDCSEPFQYVWEKICTALLDAPELKYLYVNKRCLISSENMELMRNLENVKLEYKV